MSIGQVKLINRQHKLFGSLPFNRLKILRNYIWSMKSLEKSANYCTISVSKIFNTMLITLLFTIVHLSMLTEFLVYFLKAKFPNAFRSNN